MYDFSRNRHYSTCKLPVTQKGYVMHSYHTPTQIITEACELKLYNTNIPLKVCYGFWSRFVYYDFFCQTVTYYAHVVWMSSRFFPLEKQRLFCFRICSYCISTFIHVKRGIHPGFGTQDRGQQRPKPVDQQKKTNVRQKILNKYSCSENVPSWETTFILFQDVLRIYFNITTFPSTGTEITYKSFLILSCFLHLKNALHGQNQQNTRQLSAFS